MWQVLLGAAVAGSSILAKKLLTADNNQRISDQGQEKKIDLDPPQTFQNNFHHDQDSNLVNNGSLLDKEYEVGISEATDAASIFRFSSIDHETEMGSHSRPRKKVGSFSKGVKGKIEGFKKKRSGKAKKKCGFVVGGGGQDLLVVDQRKSGIVKKLGAVCFKKRRTSKCATGKCESCSSKESSLFNWGLGIGIMYLMSAGKGEINRLNSAMDETAKAVQELKDELLRRKTFLNMHSSSSKAEGGCSSNNSMGELFNSVLNTELNNIESYDPYEKFEDLCMSDNLMEEQPDMLEMDKLEADFVSELEKLPYLSTEGSGSEGKPDSYQVRSTEYQLSGFSEKDYNGRSGPFNGVSPSELDQKLSQVLMEQQENHIAELETELVKSNYKLNEKEAELQALKDCVRRLTEFSLASISDDENEGQVSSCKTVVASPKKHVVGMKRGIDFPE